MPGLRLRWVFPLLFLAAVVTGHCAARPRKPASTGAPRFSGTEYVRLSGWAGAHGLELKWLRREEILELNGPSTKWRFTADSTEAQFNGVGVRLSFPFACRDGEAFLSQIDAEWTLRPMLSLPKNRPGEVIKNICLDPGHGGKEPGFHVGPNLEKKYNLLLAQELQQQLKRAGFNVSLTRTSDRTVDLDSRADIARRNKADLFVSLHFNSAPTSSTTVKGAEVYCLTPPGAPSSNARGEGATSQAYPGTRNNQKNLALAYQIQKVLASKLGVEDRGVHRARFAVLRDAVMPAVLIEAGFMSHPVEGRKIFDPAYRREMARAIVDGIMNYKRVVERVS